MILCIRLNECESGLHDKSQTISYHNNVCHKNPQNNLSLYLHQKFRLNYNLVSFNPVFVLILCLFWHRTLQTKLFLLFHFQVHLKWSFGSLKESQFEQNAFIEWTNQEPGGGWSYYKFKPLHRLIFTNFTLIYKL